MIGLSIAWELNRRNYRTVIVDVNDFGKKASWAGAGILAPANFETMSQPLDKLKGYGSLLHGDWSSELKKSTGVDNGYQECGGLYVARTTGEQAALIGQLDEWTEYQIPFEQLDPGSVERTLGQKPTMVVSVPGEGQICNRSHLDALIAACQNSGSELIAQCGELQFKFDSSRCEVGFAAGANRELSFDHVFLAAGAWSTSLVQQFGVNLPVIPVRGQMLLYKLKQKVTDGILNEGSRYIVPRRDGHVVVGSTTEEVGFDETTTPTAIEDLKKFAADWYPQLNASALISAWAGLRPASHDGFPFMGRLAEFENVWIATGHFKAGLQMAPAVAEVMADMLAGNPPRMDASAFAPSRLNVEA